MEKEVEYVAPDDRRFQHGVHAFIFLSFIFAEALTLTIYAWIDFLHSTIPLKVIVFRPEVMLLLAITILTVQYWWAVFESTAFYGDNLGYFLFGVLESGTIFAIARLLRDFFSEPEDRFPYDTQLTRVFICFLVLIILFIATDLRKRKEYKGLVARWYSQVLRGCGIAICVGGLCWHQPVIAARLLLLLVVVYTISVIRDEFDKKEEAKRKAEEERQKQKEKQQPPPSVTPATTKLNPANFRIPRRVGRSQQVAFVNESSTVVRS